jgi:hypothetical protein
MMDIRHDPIDFLLRLRFVAVGLALLGIALVSSHVAAAEVKLPDRVDYNFHVKPILSDRCFTCHGPDANKRQADLRLDIKDGLFTEAFASDAARIVEPGKPAESALYQRISSGDEDMQMPPPDSNLSLNDREIAIVRRWIEQGAPWKPHWSFVPMEDVGIPQVQDTAWPRNPIDYFVLAQIEREGLRPAAEANRETLIRRLSFDLTGLPPTLDQIDAFLADESRDADERLVDRLLASPHCGQRMAVDWLDAARYADTFGYQADVYRAVWPWRDWVVDAFNKNLPYDQFVTWQVAGDLLDNPTREQVLATAFNRLHRQTNEGGSTEEEFRVEYVADRVNTFGAAFLGLTLECARCHDHKYDPVTQVEYYQLASFFDNIDECGLYSHFTDATPTPTLLLTTPEQQQKIDDLQGRIGEAEAQLAQIAATRREAFQQWLAGEPSEAAVPGLVGDFSFDAIEGNKVVNDADPKQPGNLSDNPAVADGKIGNGLRLSGENNVTFAVGGGFTRNDPFSIALWLNTPDVKQRAVIYHRSRAWTDAGSRGYQLLLEDGCLSASLIHFWPGNAIRIRARKPVPVGEWIHVTLTYDGSSRADGLQLYVNGRLADCDVVRDNLYKNITGGGANKLTIGQRFRDKGFKNGLVDEFRVFNRGLTAVEAAHVHDGQALEAVLAAEPPQRSAEQTESLYAYYLANFDEPYRGQLAKLKQLRTERSQATDRVAEIMVMQEMAQPRPTYVLERGAYDAPTERVYPDTPASLPPWDRQWPRNRLGLARWLTDPQHPLAARVAVNRFWQGMFGRGLVATPEDLGSQGQLPSHPELLDWLAKSFVDSGWDVKALLKQIVMSATYRQTSAAAELWTVDPQNVWLARGPRHRLPAEMIRDNALAASGLLVDKMGGPPVRPYQPAGLWKEKSGKTYHREAGEGSHRRSLYTYWKRTSPPPAMMTLDAAKRDVCVVKRQTTATPLQALVLLNDPQYVEAARALAQKTISEGGDTWEGRMAYAFRTLTGRRPTAQEITVLRSLLEEQIKIFQADAAAATEFLGVGDHVWDKQLPPAELAAASVVVLTLMNFDECVTKR